MAITKLISPSTPNPLPPAGAGGDWDKAMAQLTAVKKLLSGEQMILTQWTNNTTAPALAKGSYLQHMGAIYVVDTEDYALPALSADGTYYIKLTISGETLVPTYTTDLTGFSWSSPHNGLYNATEEQVLPYQVVRVSSGASIIKRKVINLASAPNKLFSVDYLGVTNMGTMTVEGNTTIGGNTTVGGTLGVTGAISGASINTGAGDFKIGQNLRNTDTPRFIEIYSGYVFTPGNTMLMTTSNPVLSTSGSVEVQTSSFVWDGRLLGSYRFGGVATTSSSTQSPIFTVKLYKNGTLILTVVQATSKVSQEFYVDIALEEGDEIKAGIYISNSVPAGTSSATLASLYLKVNEKPDSVLVDSQISKVSARWDATF